MAINTKRTRTGIGQDSHRFLPENSSKPFVMGGVIFDEEDLPGFKANSDGDVLLHALCNAISSLTHVLILGNIADDLCLKDGITDSQVYVQEALKTLGRQKIVHVAFTVEALRPKINPMREKIRENVARMLNLDIEQVGLTATTGEGLTDYGCGDGVSVFCTLTTEEVL